MKLPAKNRYQIGWDGGAKGKRKCPAVKAVLRKEKNELRKLHDRMLRNDDDAKGVDNGEA